MFNCASLYSRHICGSSPIRECSSLEVTHSGKGVVNYGVTTYNGDNINDIESFVKFNF